MLVNATAAAGQAGRRWARLRSELRSQSISFSEVHTETAGQARALASQHASTFDVVVAAGGDGTVNEVADGLLQAGASRAALGVLPLGTGNDVAHLLGVGRLADAVACLQSGQPARMDAIEIRCRAAGQPVVRHALLFASVGFAGALLRRTTPRVKRIFGPRGCYSVGLFRALPGFRAPQLRVRWDDEVIEGRFFLACAANSEAAGGGMMRLGPGARLDDGWLNLSLIGDLSWLEVVRCFPQLRTGRHVHHPKVRYGVGREMEVTSERPLDVQMDGEVFGETPVTFRVRPRALQVLSPRVLCDSNVSTSCNT